MFAQFLLCLFAYFWIRNWSHIATAIQIFHWLYSETNWKLICSTSRNCYSAFVAPFCSYAATCELALCKYVTSYFQDVAHDIISQKKCKAPSFQIRSGWNLTEVFASIVGVRFSLCCQSFKIEAMTSLDAEKCCYLVSGHVTSDPHLCNSVCQFLIHSTFVFMSINYANDGHVWGEQGQWQATAAHAREFRSPSSGFPTFCHSLMWARWEFSLSLVISATESFSITEPILLLLLLILLYDRSLLFPLLIHRISSLSSWVLWGALELFFNWASISWEPHFETPLKPAREFGECCKAYQWGLGQSPSWNRIGAF